LENGPDLCFSQLFILIDRGEYGLECILFFLSNKLLAPERYWLLRGNHEVRGVQQQFTFHRERQDKFGTESGLQIWEIRNKKFKQ
jgi:hypothetical protein